MDSFYSSMQEQLRTTSSSSSHQTTTTKQSKLHGLDLITTRMAKDLDLQKTLVSLNLALTENQWLCGDSPTAADTQMFSILTHSNKSDSLNTSLISVELYPHAFSWFYTVAMHHPVNSRAEWPVTEDTTSKIRFVVKRMAQETPQQIQPKPSSPKKPQPEQENVSQPPDSNNATSPKSTPPDLYANWIPPEQRRPEDEFIDLSQILPLYTEDVWLDGSIIKLVIKEGTGPIVGNTEEDTVFYTHQTRYDNGQLVDLDERSKVSMKCHMGNKEFHDYLRAAFCGMKRGEIAYLKINEKVHHGIYHKSLQLLQSNSMCKKRTTEELQKMKDSVGNDIYIKIGITKIERDPRCEDKTASFEERVLFFQKIRDVGKELTQVEEWSNAKTLYQRCVGTFKNIPVKLKNLLTEEQVSKRDEILVILYSNSSLCTLKKGLFKETLKLCSELLLIKPQNNSSDQQQQFLDFQVKAHYRMCQAYKKLNNLDKAKECLLQTIKLKPVDPALRSEYKTICEALSRKENDWRDKMAGFLQPVQITKEGKQQSGKDCQEKREMELFESTLNTRQRLELLEAKEYERKMLKEKIDRLNGF